MDFSAPIPEVESWLGILKDAVVAASALTGGIVAIIGLRTWRRQLRGQTEYDLARRYLRSVLKVRDGIRAVRSPFMGPGEIREALNQAGIEADQGQVDQQTYTRSAYSARWSRLSAALSDLRVEAVEAEVLWGAAAQDKLAPLDKTIGELYAALHRYLDNLERPERNPPPDPHERHDAIIYELSSDPEKDPFTAKVSAAVKEVEDFVKPKLRL